MSLADVYLFSRAPREMARYYMGSIIVLFVFILLFDDFISALLYYLAFLIISIPFLYLIGRVVAKKQLVEDEQSIKSDVEREKNISREQVDKYIDKTRCMSCRSPVEADESFCSNCGFKLIK
jgi:multisubunit Na+/H+ antiporter MnhG subunit